jgi:hypothetical protein
MKQRGGARQVAATTTESVAPSSVESVSRETQAASVGALTSTVPENISWIFGLACNSLDAANSEWILLDRGSMIHACGKGIAADVPMVPTSPRDLRSVTGSRINHYGKKVVDMQLGSSGQRVPARVTFEVTSVRYPVLSLGRIFTSGPVSLHMEGSTGYLQKGSKRVPVCVRDNVLMVQASRKSRPLTPVIVAPLGEGSRSADSNVRRL